MRLSKARKEVLRAMKAGATLYWFPGGRPCLLPSRMRVYKATASFLIEHAFVRLVNPNQPCCEWKITPAGIEALGEQDEAESE